MDASELKKIEDQRSFTNAIEGVAGHVPESLFKELMLYLNDGRIVYYDGTQYNDGSGPVDIDPSAIRDVRWKMQGESFESYCVRCPSSIGPAEAVAKQNNSVQSVLSDLKQSIGVTVDRKQPISEAMAAGTIGVECLETRLNEAKQAKEALPSSKVGPSTNT